MTNSSYLVRREIYQNKNVSKDIKNSDGLIPEGIGTDGVADQSGMNEKKQPSEVSSIVNTEEDDN